jgi:sugar/nucleoside kinase (ribokinase family)
VAKQQRVDLVGVGLNATDTLIHVSSFPLSGSKVEYETEIIMPGGQVASTVIACQTWGLRTRYVGKLGDDDASRLHAREFLRAGAEAHLIHVPATPSARSLILVDHTGERTVLCRRDERLILQPAELDREWIVNARALHVDGHDTAAATVAARWAREAGVLVIADLDDAYEGVEELLHNIDFLIVSRDLPGRLTGKPNLRTALREMQSRFGCRLTAATLGHDGVLAWDREQFHHAPAFRVPVVDTTGAGDIFHAGFIYGLLQGWPLPRNLDFSCAAAAINCMAEGARGGIGSVDQIESFMLTTPRYQEAEEHAAASTG